jgi:FtsP/CotA-like multicopper oxidase with cupredoxin domain
MINRIVVPLAFLMILLVSIPSAMSAVREYHLTIAQQKVIIRDKSGKGMTINGNIPGPTLYFQEGDLARIHVKNEMNVATSLHWHGLLVPPTMDGVPFVAQVPIEPGTTLTYEFPIRQTGTYWYHSHSGLQEQSGLYGSIVIEDGKYQTERDYVLLLSDWTTESPDSVLRTLKRGSHWYALQKGSSQSIFGAAKADRIGDYFIRELQRMPPMDIADIAYDYFLSNGQLETMLEAHQGETVRLRVINGSATTYFHLNFSGGPMTIVSADGQLVQPVENDLFLIGVAETYDVFVTIPEQGSYEFRATAHDGSGFTSTWLGTGTKYPALAIPKPNLYEPMGHGEMGSIFALTPAGTMGMSDSMVDKGIFDKPGMAHSGHGMSQGARMDRQGHRTGHDLKHPMQHGSMPKSHKVEEADMEPMGMQKIMGTADPEKLRQPAITGDKHQAHQDDTPYQSDQGVYMYGTGFAEHVPSARPFGRSFGLLEADIASRPHLSSEGGPQRPTTPYDLLKSIEPTRLPADAPVREIRLTLDGDMQRYTWFLNNKPISETDSILIREGEIARFIMINRTMMHHPMHLHGHFFRVLKGQGDSAPLKHSVDVAPMETTVIEFYADEVGDWFFHCHLLYHMKSGMSRMIHYKDFEAAPDVNAVRNKLYKDPLYFYGSAELLSTMTEGSLTLSNSRCEFKAGWEVGWESVDKTDWEGLVTVDYHVNRFTSFFTGVDFFGEGSSGEETRGILGVRYLLPLNFESSAWLDNDGGQRFMLEKEFELTPRIGLHGEVEYDTHEQWEGKVGLSYLINKEFSILANWHSEYGIGFGLQLRF